MKSMMQLRSGLSVKRLWSLGRSRAFSSAAGRVRVDKLCLRSVLYVPGSNQKALNKAKSLNCDGYILDLEDAVAPSSKATARRQTLSFLSGTKDAEKFAIRINGETTAWYTEDVKAFATSASTTVVLPKVETPESVEQLTKAIENETDKDFRVWCMIETPLGILHSYDIAMANAKVECLVAGTTDLAAELRVKSSQQRAALLHSLSQIVLAARAAKLPALDGVYLDIRDLEGFEAECRQGLAMGFDGKTLIHPSTVTSTNAIFSPTESELNHAREVITEYGKAQLEGSGVAVVHGRLVEEMHVREAERVLALQHRIETNE